MAPPGNQAANGENKYQPKYWEKPVYSTQFFNVSFAGALLIGFVQCFSMLPGVSRAAATGYDMLKTSSHFNNGQWTLLISGGLVAFVSAMVAVKAFIAFVSRYGFRHFGYYRIVLGLFFLAASAALGTSL